MCLGKYRWICEKLPVGNEISQWSGDWPWIANDDSFPLLSFKRCPLGSLLLKSYWMISCAIFHEAWKVEVWSSNVKPSRTRRFWSNTMFIATPTNTNSLLAFWPQALETSIIAVFSDILNNTYRIVFQTMILKAEGTANDTEHVWRSENAQGPLHVCMPSWKHIVF